VSRITISRPEARNALDQASVQALLDALVEAEAAPESRSILLSATGPVFSTGLEFSDVLLSSTIAGLRVLHRLLSFGLHTTKPLVVAAQGAALGAGAILCASAHVALAAQGTSFGFTDIRAGQWPYIGWRTLERAIGHRRALELTLTGRVFNAQDALAWGLIHEITQPSELEDRAFATASVLAAGPPQTIAAALRWVQHPSDPCQSALDHLQSLEAREGLAAFLEKRRPSWPGSDVSPAAD
jgi:enoyl-CoA hydratase/carnithine racemase